MIVMIDDNTKRVHLLGLDWGDISLISSSLYATAAKTNNEQVSKRADNIISLIDAGTESVLAANMEPEDGDNI